MSAPPAAVMGTRLDKNDSEEVCSALLPVTVYAFLASGSFASLEFEKLFLVQNSSYASKQSITRILSHS